MPVILSRAEWEAAQRAHEAAVEDMIAPHRRRMGRGQKHPVFDFLFTYYSLRPGQLRRWYPGPDVILQDAADRADWPLHTLADDNSLSLDLPAASARLASSISFVRSVLAGTARRPAQFGCFGLHEWAMVYRQPAEERRHDAWPLRLGGSGTDEVVQAHQLRCSHYDAFRFYTPAARGRNLLQPSKTGRPDQEQPGCLHANMDLYKWAYKLLPATPGELLRACFELARDIREVDMRASPYDLRALGFEPIAIETPAGKAEYTARQREFADRAAPLRARLEALAELLAADDSPPQA